MIVETRACLSHWYPVLRAAGVRQPETELVRAADCGVAPGTLAAVLDGDVPAGFDALVTAIVGAARRVTNRAAGPFFLRTGHTSGKHDWERTCFVADITSEAVATAVAGLVEASELAGFLGLPADVWVVRELLPTDPILVMDRYRGLPLNPEVRAFVRGGSVECMHAYWPARAVADGIGTPLDDATGRLVMALASTVVTDDVPALWAETVKAAAALDAAEPGSYWSVDLLMSGGAWYVIDCAPGELSYHDPECPRVLTPNPNPKAGA